jgi:hypothetical protein
MISFISECWCQYIYLPMNKKKKILAAFTILILALILLAFIPENTKQIKTKHFNFIFSSSINRGSISDLAYALEDSYRRISNDLQTIPANNIETHIYASRWRYIKATKNWTASGNIEGSSKLHFVQKGWNESESKKIAIHEFAHAVTLQLLLDNDQKPFNAKAFDKKFTTFPVWLWEAISVYEAGQFVDPKTLPYFNHGQYPSLPELNERFKGGKIYSCGYTVIEYILSKYGRQNLINLIKTYGNLEQTFHVTSDEFSRGWYQFVTEKYFRQASFMQPSGYNI